MSNLVYMYYVSGLTLSCFLCVCQYDYSPQISLLGCGQVIVSVRAVYRACSHSLPLLPVHVYRDVLISGVEKHTNMVLGVEESVLFREVSLFQGCPYRVVPLYIVMYTQQVRHVLLYTDMYIWYNYADRCTCIIIIHCA